MLTTNCGVLNVLMRQLRGQQLPHMAVVNEAGAEEHCGTGRYMQPSFVGILEAHQCDELPYSNRPSGEHLAERRQVGRTDVTVEVPVGSKDESVTGYVHLVDERADVCFACRHLHKRRDVPPRYLSDKAVSLGVQPMGTTVRDEPHQPFHDYRALWLASTVRMTPMMESFCSAELDAATSVSAAIVFSGMRRAPLRSR